MNVTPAPCFRSGIQLLPSGAPIQPSGQRPSGWIGDFPYPISVRFSVSHEVIMEQPLILPLSAIPLRPTTRSAPAGFR